MIVFMFYVCIFPRSILSDNNDSIFNLTVLHTNDVHSRYSEINTHGQSCNRDVEPCFGGIARLTTAVRQAQQQQDNVLLLDAGDVQTGSLWYLTYQGNASVNFMTNLGYDAMVIHLLCTIVLFVIEIF